MVAANCWPLGRNRPTMTIEMVNLPIFSEGVGVLFPQFGFQPKEGHAVEKIVKSMEVGVREILGEMSDKEYLVRRAIAGTMPVLITFLRNLGFIMRSMMCLRRYISH